MPWYHIWHARLQPVALGVALSLERPQLLGPLPPVRELPLLADPRRLGGGSGLDVLRARLLLANEGAAVCLRRRRGGGGGGHRRRLQQAYRTETRKKKWAIHERGNSLARFHHDQGQCRLIISA